MTAQVTTAVVGCRGQEITTPPCEPLGRFNPSMTFDLHARDENLSTKNKWDERTYASCTVPGSCLPCWAPKGINFPEVK